jgi:hypothetical protein
MQNLAPSLLSVWHVGHFIFYILHQKYWGEQSGMNELKKTQCPFEG